MGKPESPGPEVEEVEKEKKRSDELTEDGPSPAFEANFTGDVVAWVNSILRASGNPTC